MSEYKGTNFVGAATLLTSTANVEVLSRVVYNFQLMNDQVCTVKINNGAPIYLRALQGIEIPVAYSVVIVEAGITYNWIAVL